MSDRLTLGSLFSGSGTFELGGMLAGIQPIWNSEIEPFPIMVTRRRLPHVKHYGDVSALDGAALEPVDIITFGSPCQDMSVAGRRAGLAGSRSGLFHQAIRIIREMREATHGRQPRFIVWENVPGAFSSNRGRDFGAVLDEVIGIKESGASVPAPDKGRWPYADLFLGDGWSVAYRVLDAQYWGVAQRRRRVFLVADFDSERAGEILFEREGVQRNPGQGCEAWKGAAGDSAQGAGGDGRGCIAAGFIPGASMMHSSGIGYHEEVSPTLRANGDTAVVEMIDQQPFGIGAFNSLAWLSDNPRAGIYRANTARTLDASGGNPSAHQGGMAVVETYAVTMNTFIQVEKDRTPTLMARDYKDPIAITDPVTYRVRRLTPKECARLQGFPDWWCDDLGTEDPTEDDIRFWADVFETHRRLVSGTGKPKTRNQIMKWLRDPYSDGAEYKLWGNGCALPCVYFLMAGIAKVNTST